MAADTPAEVGTGWSFPQKVLFVAVVVALALLLWRLAHVLLLVFGGVVLAVALRALARRLERHLHVPPQASVLVAVLIVVAVLVAAGWAVGTPLAEQFGRLREQVPAAIEAARAWLASQALGQRLLELWRDMRQTATDGMPWARLLGVAGLTLNAVGSMALMMLIAVFLAASPRTYERGLVRLVPVPYRARMRDALQACDEALSRWLLGQAVSMLFVGTATALTLAVLGVPLAAAVGLLAGLMAFVPFFGAIAAGLLSVLLAFAQGPQTALYAAVAFLVIQQIEENVLMPFVQRWAVQLPPVLGLMAALVFGVLFGLPGVLFATPLMVVAMVLVQRLYIESVLESA